MNIGTLLDTAPTDRIVGICLEQARPRLIENLTRLASHHRLHVFGQQVPGAQCTLDADPSGVMLRAFAEGRIHAFVRGVNDDYRFQIRLAEQFGWKDIQRLVFFRDVHGHEFAYGPVSAREGKGYEERLRYARRAIDFMTALGLEPRVAVMANCRPGSCETDDDTRTSHSEAERLVTELRPYTAECCNVGIELDRAVQWANLVLAVSGVVGNQVFRSLALLGGGRIIGIPAFAAGTNPLRHCYEDNSRNEDVFDDHVRAAIVWASRQ